MFEKTLHGANIATCCAALATAADLTLTGGAAGAIAAALSGVALFKKADTTTRNMAKDMADAFDAALAQNNLQGDRRKIAVQMFAHFPPSEEELATGSMSPTVIAANMRALVEATATDPAHKSDTALNDYTAIITAVATPLCVPSDQKEAMLAELLKRSDQSGRAGSLRDEGITEKAIIRLAQRIAADTDDIGQAWLELQNAMDIAVRVQAEGQVQSNHGNFVDTVLARVAELAKDGDYTAAGAAIDEALEQAEAQVIRLLESGVEVALLDRDTAKAAALLVRKADMEAGGVAEFETLSALQDHYYEIGRDKGSNLDSMLAIDLANLVLARATTPNERGNAWNDLGLALGRLGERESGKNRLEQAFTAFIQAFKEISRDRTPMDWAKIQGNLGNTLARLGERDIGSDRLEQAVTAYTEILKEHSRDRTPLDWAMTQMNLGNALTKLGERENGTARLLQAVTAYSQALKEFTRNGVPMQWAMTHLNLGTVFLALGERENATARLDQAVTAYTEALKEYTRDRTPLDWAITQLNLAAVEGAYFGKTNDPAHLDRAASFADVAREIFVEAQASRYIMMTDQILDAIQSRRS
ncbi:tetratricopeptide repeat protein [Litoreibacter meonggei]|uniref:Tetratricopeptide repeat protein n=1 Tax=Litoreibacter meonggei TaxID=1049199 RepID=A0A497WNK7_9RHOB|nr:tetratricopeptide repeat protein [Litoreibacter meonggei]RLJ51539.1 tetratricopeptide repeat protein [Litoreibacter meonggei]